MTDQVSEASGASPASGAPPITPAEQAHRFNLSAWTLKHQPLVIFLLALLTLILVASVVVFGLLGDDRLASVCDCSPSVMVWFYSAASGLAARGFPTPRFSSAGSRCSGHSR